MIDAYFFLKQPGEAVGAISLKERNANLKVDIWETYKIFPITEKTVLFKRMETEFCTTNGKYHHEMGNIQVKYIDNEWLNVKITEL